MIGLYVLALFASILAGFINTLVGSGSLIMIPLLMSMGLPAQTANGTNRVAILFQSMVGANTFFKTKKIIIGDGWWLISSCTLGALVGAWLATQLDAKLFEQFIGILLILMLVLILLKPEKWMKDNPDKTEKNKTFAALITMFFTGIYGGFVQGGVGIFLLAGLVMVSDYRLSKANAIKLIIVLAYALPVLIIFILYDQVDWFLGLFTAVGQSIGAYLGAKFALKYPNANLWIYRLLVLILVASIIHLYQLWMYFY